MIIGPGGGTVPDPLAETAKYLADQVVELRKDIKDLKTAKKRGFRAILGAYGLWLVDIVLIGVMALFGHYVKSSNECQAQENAAFRHAIVAARSATNTERASLREFIDVAFDPNASRDEKVAAGARYQNALHAADKTRNDNPLPESSNC